MTVEQGSLATDGTTSLGPAPTAAALPSHPSGPATAKKNTWRRALKKDWRLYTFLIVPIIFLLIFRYLPMAGNVIAFRRFRPGSSIFGDEWVGLRYVEMFISDPKFWEVFQNTVIIGALSLAICFPMPILLALLLNEVRVRWFKRLVQTVSYLPHFMSIVIVAGLVFQIFSVQGTIDSQLYESSRIDGANRLQQTWHITLVGIRPTMVTLLVLNIGTFLSVGFEKVLLLYNPLTYPTADVIATYLYRIGIESSNFSYATAIGLFESIIGLVLVLSANEISKRAVGTSLW